MTFITIHEFLEDLGLRTHLFPKGKKKKAQLIAERFSIVFQIPVCNLTNNIFKKKNYSHHYRIGNLFWKFGGKPLRDLKQILLLFYLFFFNGDFRTTNFF